MFEEKRRNNTHHQKQVTTMKIKEIIIHCSATTEGRNYTVSDIDRWHRKQEIGRAHV